MDRREFLGAAAAVPIALATEPFAFAARLGGTPIAFVTADLESHVVVLDLTSAKTIARIRTAPGPRSIETVLGHAVVAHTEQGAISILGVTPYAVRAELAGFDAPRYACAHPPTSDRGSALAYITDSAREELVTLDVSRANVVTRTSVPGPARHTSISPEGKTIWAALGTKAERIAVLDTSDPRRPRLVRMLDPPFLAHDVVFAPDGRSVWVTSGSERRIAIYDRRSRHPIRILRADAPPQHVTFADGLAFVASGDDGTVRLHRRDGSFVREAPVPLGSYNVTFGWRRAVTPSLARGTVAFLDGRGRVRATRTIARAAHDACVLLGP
jgi:hypothetical protein